MRILFVSHGYLPSLSGGTQVWLAGIASQLSVLGHSVSVIAAENSTDSRIDDLDTPVLCWKGERDGIDVFRLTFNRYATGVPAPWHDVLNPGIEQSVREIVQVLEPDVVVATCGHSMTVSPVKAAQSLGIPVIIRLTGFWYLCPITTLLRPDNSLCEGHKSGIECLNCLSPSSRVGRWLGLSPARMRQFISHWNLRNTFGADRNRAMEIVRAVDYRNLIFSQALRTVDRILAPSEALRSSFIDAGIVPSDKIIHWPQGINVAHVESGRKKTPALTLRLGYTGHVLRHKGIDILVRAVRSLPAEDAIELFVYGSLEHDPSYARELIALAGGDPRIHFQGGYDNARIGDILQQIDVVVAPSLWVENNPIAIHEAIAAHTPVIATNLGGMAELILHEYNGLLFERSDWVGLATQIARLVREPDLLAGIQANARPMRSIDDEAKALAGLCSVVKDEYSSKSAA